MSLAIEPVLPALDWTTLKARFKQLQIQTQNVFQNWQIRVHRALSWLKRAAELPDDEPDLKFMLMWVSLNSLYSRWDAARNAPGQDNAARSKFIVRVCAMDQERIGTLLRRHRSLIKKLLENPFLSSTFWRDPSNPKAKGWATQDANYLDRNLKNNDSCRVLEQVLDRLYVMRGQLMHGAATGGGKLNRQTLKYCLELLRVFTPVLIYMAIEHGANDDWPDLCYPPLT